MKHLITILVLSSFLALSITGFSQNVLISDDNTATPHTNPANDGLLQLRKVGPFLLDIHDSTALGLGTGAEIAFKTGTTSVLWTAKIKSIGIDASTARLSFFTGTNATRDNLLERMTILDGGNVGIGTTGPATTLDVNGVTNSATGYRVGNAATAGNYLRGNGTNFVSSAIQASDLPSSFSGLANPTATIGLTVINGSLATAMRSDAAPALSQAIVPAWTGTHTFSNAIYSALFTGGNVGIGTSSPAATAKVDITSTNSGLLIPRMTTAQRTAITSPATGLIIFNTECNLIQYYTGTKWVSINNNITNGGCGTSTGCSASADGDYTVLKFTGVGTTTWTVPCGVTSIDYLVVAGGGGGGGEIATGVSGSGGGAGGLVYATGVNVSTLGTSPLTVTVGYGGNGGYSRPGSGTNGGSSVLGNITATGGGYGTSYQGTAGGGGSGGGAGCYGGTRGHGNGQGHDGGTASNYGGAGGGGSSVDGGSTTSYDGGNGGDGTSINITGFAVIYAGGGGGGRYSTGAFGIGGSGGGGTANSQVGGSGTNNLGGGGAGGGSNTVNCTGGAGGSGIVIIRYLTP